MTLEEKKEKILFSWTAPEFIRQPKNTGWFIIFFFVASIFLALSLWFKNYFFSGLIILATGLFFIQALKVPKSFYFSITEEGFKINDKLIPYKEIDSFWIFANSPFSSLSLKTKNLINSHLIILLKYQDAKKIRDLLLNFVKEKEETEESFSDWLAKKINF